MEKTAGKKNYREKHLNDLSVNNYLYSEVQENSRAYEEKVSTKLECETLISQDKREFRNLRQNIFNIRQSKRARSKSLLITPRSNTKDKTHEHIETIDVPLNEYFIKLLKTDENDEAKVMKKEMPKRSRTFSSANNSSEQQIFTNNSFASLDLEARIGINIFNMNPLLALSYFLSCFHNMNNPNEIATFLKSCPFLSKKKIGELLGNISNKFCEEILIEFINKFEVYGVPLEDSYRKFMSCFTMPGESQKIERILELFSRQYFLSNKAINFDDYPYEKEDTVLLILYALTMLNSDLHNCAIKKKMKREEFIKNVKRTESCANVSVEILGQFYDNILNKEFKAGFDNTSQLIQLRKLFYTNDLNFVIDNRQLITIFEGNEIYIDIFNRINLKPRTFLMFNDCFIFLKKLSNTYPNQKSDIQYKCKRIFKLVEYKVYPNQESLVPNTLSFCCTTNKIPIDISINKRQTHNAILTYSKIFSYETEFTHAIMCKLKQSKIELLSCPRDNEDEYKKACAALKSELFELDASV